MAKVVEIVNFDNDLCCNTECSAEIDSETWQCSLCFKKFPDLSSEMWTHIQEGACLAQASGIRIDLENNLIGFINLENLSDESVKDPQDYAKCGQNIKCRIMKIDFDRFTIECSAISSVLLDRENKWKPKKDNYYDYNQESNDAQLEINVRLVQLFIEFLFHLFSPFFT